MNIKLAVSAALAMACSAGYAKAENISLRIGSGHPSGSIVYVSEMQKFFVPEVVKRVKQRTGDTVVFTEVYGGSVTKVNETLQGVQVGLLDIGGFCMCFEQSRLAVHNFPYWVPFGSHSAVAAARATRKVYDEFPVLTQEFEKKHGQKLLAFSGYENYDLGTTFPWTDLKDLKGRKIGAAGPNLPWIQGSGAVGVASNVPDAYNALQSGIYSGWIMFPSAYNSFKFYEPAPHYKVVNFGAVMVNALTINSATWKRLSPEVQKVISEVAREYEQRQAVTLDETAKAGLQALEKVAKVSILSPEARTEWAEGLKTWPSRAAQDAKRATGLPAPAILRAYLKHLQSDGYRPPVAYEIRD